jgi:hypothetical protein
VERLGDPPPSPAAVWAPLFVRGWFHILGNMLFLFLSGLHRGLYGRSIFAGLYSSRVAGNLLPPRLPSLSRWRRAIASRGAFLSGRRESASDLGHLPAHVALQACCRPRGVPL